MIIKRNGRNFELTAEELYDAYRVQEKLYRLEDAQRHLYCYLNVDAEDVDGVDSQEAMQAFFKEYGFALTEACDPESPNYLLDAIVCNFETDCNVAENDLFQEAVCQALDEVKDLANAS